MADLFIKVRPIRQKALLQRAKRFSTFLHMNATHSPKLLRELLLSESDGMVDKTL